MGIAEEIENLIRPVLSEQKFELVDIQYRKEPGGWILRLFIDKIIDSAIPDSEKKTGSSVTLDDCEKVSDIIGSLLDQSVILNVPYNLEVSSPGINRPLKNEKDFKNHLNEKVRVSLYAPLSEQSKQKNFSGILISSENQMIEVEDVVSGKTQIPISAIAKANLDII